MPLEGLRGSLECTLLAGGVMQSPWYSCRASVTGMVRLDFERAFVVPRSRSVISATRPAFRKPVVRVEMSGVEPQGALERRFRIAMAQLAAVAPDVDARLAQRRFDTASGLGVLRRVTQEHDSCTHCRLF